MKHQKMIERLMKLPIPKLEKKADQAFQLRRRMEEADRSGVVKCITCGKYGSYWTFDAGHFIQREHKGTRHDPLNVWPQCKQCNQFKGGRYAIYRDNLIKKIGKEKLEEMESRKDNDMFGVGRSYRDHCIEVFMESKEIIIVLETESNWQ